MDRKPRLTPKDWIRVGFSALVTEGPEAVRAEPLARRLETTKGSFYWHFADVPTFHRAMLAAWQAEATTALSAELARSLTPAAQLRRFGQIAPRVLTPDLTDTPLGPAVRAWALGTPAAADTLAAIDTHSLTLLHGLLGDMGITNPEIARLLLGAGIGLADLSRRNSEDPGAAMGTLVDLVLALR